MHQINNTATAECLPVSASSTNRRSPPLSSSVAHLTQVAGSAHRRTYWKVLLVGAVSLRVLDARYLCSLILFLELFYWALICPAYCISSMFYIIP
jgi:hypothetical protein